MNTTTTNEIREENESIICQFAIDHRLKFPMGSSHIVTLANACGYNLDRRLMDRILEKGLVRRPPKNASRQIVWDMESTLDLFDALERSRRWLAGHTRHRKKMTVDEISKQQEDISAICGNLEDWANASPVELIRLLVNSDQRQERLAIAAIFLTKAGMVDAR